MLANRYADPGLVGRLPPEDAVGKVLNGEVRLWRHRHKGAQPGISRRVHGDLQAHGSRPRSRRSSRGSSKLQLPNEVTSSCRAAEISAVVACSSFQRNPALSKTKLPAS